MRLAASGPCLGLVVACALVLTLAPPGSDHPVPTEQGRLVLVERLGHAGVGFNWRNLTCPVCKALFTVLDVALLVTRDHLFSRILLSSPEFFRLIRWRLLLFNLLIATHWSPASELLMV